MNLISKEDIFNNKIVNIFTDASSFLQENGKYITCSSVMVYVGDQLIRSEKLVFRDSTISIAELFAVYRGIVLGYEVSKLFNIEISFLFSDSAYSICGLTEWLESWVRNSSNGIMMNTSNKEVANQKIFHEAISFIVKKKYNIRLVKIRGHVDNSDDMIKAIRYINDKNYVFRHVKVDKNTVEEISKRNNLVDADAKKAAAYCFRLDRKSIPQASLIFPIHFFETTWEVFEEYCYYIKLNIGVKKENGCIYY